MNSCHLLNMLTGTFRRIFHVLSTLVESTMIGDSSVIYLPLIENLEKKTMKQWINESITNKNGFWALQTTFPHKLN